MWPDRSRPVGVNFQPQHMEKTMRTTISATALLLLSACEQPKQDETAPATMQEAPTPTPAKVSAIGEFVAAPGFEFTLKSVEEQSKPGNSPYAQPAGDGQTYVVAKFTFKNIGTKPVDKRSLPEVELVDPNGTAYSWDVVASAFAADESSMDDINPGVSRRSGMAWKVAKGAFDPAGWKVVLRSDPPVEFKLK